MDIFISTTLQEVGVYMTLCCKNTVILCAYYEYCPIHTLMFHHSGYRYTLACDLSQEYKIWYNEWNWEYKWPNAFK